MSDAIYLVMGGRERMYEDCHWHVAAFTNEDAAKEWVRKAQACVDRLHDICAPLIDGNDSLDEKWQDVHNYLVDIPRELWEAYEQYGQDIIQYTSTKKAPWILVEANNKQYARLKVLQTVIDHLHERLD